MATLLPFVVVSFAANSLITRFLVARGLLDAGLVGATRFAAGAVVLAAVALARGERTLVRRAHLVPALWLGVYAVCISYGYVFIGAAPGTVVFYCAVLVTLIGYDRFTGTPVAPRRLVGAAVALAGVATLAVEAGGVVTVLGVVLLAATGITWGLYTAAGRGAADPRTATTGRSSWSPPLRECRAARRCGGGTARDRAGAGLGGGHGCGADGAGLHRVVRVPALDVGHDRGHGPARHPRPHRRGCRSAARRAPLRGPVRRGGAGRRRDVAGPARTA